jgi:hypothetical protein
MTEDQAIKAQELLEELQELRKIDDLLSDKEYKKSVNVTFNQHYGENGKRVRVKSRHFPKFLNVMREVIQDVETELHKL